jgi:putative phage-type endonuclease
MSDEECEKQISMRDRLIFYTNDMLPQFTESRLEFNRLQVERLKLIPQPAQRSPEWYEMRHSMLSASDWGTILGMSKYGGGKNQVLLKKCCDDVPFFTNAAMQWGIKYEAVAIQIYEHRNQTSVIEFGCIRHPTLHFLGASPDGITADGVMVEIKCPSSRVIDGIIPEGYYCQVQGQLEVCELDRCDFLECRIMEYTDQDDYETDCSKECDFHKNHYGMEKGAVANFIDMIENKSHYEYSPIGIIGEDLVKWKAEVLAKYRHQNRYAFEKFTYWYLERVSCIPIYRNQEWFYKASKELREFWEKVCYYRSVGPEKLKEDIQKEKDDKIADKAAMKEAKEKEVKEKKSSGKSRKITEFISTGDGDSDNEFQKHYNENDVFSVFSDEPLQQVEQKKNVIKKTVEKKSVVKKEKKEMQSSSLNILNIFTDEEVQDMKK